MASIIRVKRSTGTVAPLSLEYGELAYTVGVGTHGNSGGRLFVGDFSENTLVIGGRYFADLLSIGPGLVAGQSNRPSGDILAAHNFLTSVTAVVGWLSQLVFQKKTDMKQN